MTRKKSSKRPSSGSKKTSELSTLIALDIGNTAATCGLFKSGALEAFESRLHDDIPNFIKKCSKMGGCGPFNLVISSVVPKVTQKLRQAIKPKPAGFWVVGENLQLPLKHKYHNIKQLGADRIVNLYGALQRYTPPFLVIDFGTAITFDYVSAEKVFEGGMIVPGPELAFKALLSKAALLPKNARLPEKTVSFLGTDTYSCMNSGIMNAYGAMADGLIERFKSRFGTDLRVIATGGFASHLKPYTRSFEILDPRHAVYSLYSAYQNLCQ